MNNAKDGNVKFLDHKSGQGSTVGTTNNMGNMQVNGNHNFDKFNNQGNLMAGARMFNPDGSPAPQLMLMDLEELENLVAVNNFNNAGQASFQGQHTVKNLVNQEKGMVQFKDDKSGQGTTVGNTKNMGQIMAQGNHTFDNF